MRSQETVINHSHSINCDCKVKHALLGLRKCLLTESPLQMMKNSFYFTLKELRNYKRKLFLCPPQK